MFRDQDPLAAFLSKQQRRLLDCIEAIGAGEGAARIGEARRILSALDEAERDLLYPAFARTSLDPAIEHLLDDSRGERRRQLEKLETLALKRAPRLRKLASVALADSIEHHHRAVTTRSVPVLASRLPRPVHRALTSAFVARVESAVAAPGSRTTIDRAPVLARTG